MPGLKSQVAEFCFCKKQDRDELKSSSLPHKKSKKNQQKSELSKVRIFPSNSQDFTTPQSSFEFSGFYYTPNSFLIKTNHNKQLKNSPFSRNLVTTERKRRGQDGVMWTEDHKRSDTNHIAWINRIQSNTTHCVMLGLIKAQESCIDTFTAQSTDPGPFGGFSFWSSTKNVSGSFFVSAWIW